MFINYLVYEFWFMFVYELVLVHELSEFMSIHEQSMFMNKVRDHEQYKFNEIVCLILSLLFVNLCSSFLFIVFFCITFTLY